MIPTGLDIPLKQGRCPMKRRIVATLLMTALLGLVATSCEVRETVVRRPCVGAIWIGGHYDRFGAWHQPHWRCPGVVEVIE